MSVLDDVSPALPLMQKAAEIKRRAAAFGFDWLTVEDLLRHAEEELQEIKEAVATGDTAAITDEMGDLLFVIANLARFTGTDADAALSGAIEKFSSRFRCLERLLSERNLDPATADLGALWKEAKRLNKPQ